MIADMIIVEKNAAISIYAVKYPIDATPFIGGGDFEGFPIPCDVGRKRSVAVACVIN